jgi:hypothetical protein
MSERVVVCERCGTVEREHDRATHEFQAVERIVVRPNGPMPAEIVRWGCE